MFLASCFKYCSRGFPMAFFFPDIAPSRMFTTNSLCLILCPIHEWRLLFLIFKSNLSSFALWKTLLFVILPVHFVFHILLQHHISNAFMTLSLFNPLNAELHPICYLLALLAHHFLHVSRIRVKSLTLRLLMSYIYIWSTNSWCF